jgi:hypothetical protein
MEYKTTTCGLCRFEFMHGAHVCQGCRGEIVYGATKRERDDNLKYGFISGLIIAGAFVYGIPTLLNAKLGMSISQGFGLGGYALGLTAIGGIAAAGYALVAVERRKAKLVRTFRVRYVT